MKKIVSTRGIDGILNFDETSTALFTCFPLFYLFILFGIVNKTMWEKYNILRFHGDNNIGLLFILKTQTHKL